MNLPKRPGALILDDLRSSYNIGAIIRLADAFRLQSVVVCGKSHVSEKKLKKVAKNTNKWVDIKYSENLSEVLDSYIDLGYVINSLELCDDSSDYHHITYSPKYVFILGNEKHGVSKSALDLSNQKIYIPMYGMGNSLNVSTAAAAIISAEYIPQLYRSE